METPTIPLRTAVPRWLKKWLVRAAAWSLAGLPIAAIAAEDLQLRDQGKLHTYEVAEDEAVIFKWGATKGELAQQLSSKLPSAAVLKNYGQSLLVKLPNPLSRKAAQSGTDPQLSALTGVDWKPVIYLKGANHQESTRRAITREVVAELPAGKTAEALLVESGAIKVRPTKQDGRILLEFASPWKAVDAADALRKAGTNAEVVLARVYERMAAPNDPYFANQWHLRNTGQGGGTPTIDVDIINAWDITKANGVNVVVVDDSMQVQSTAGSVNTGHPDLRPNTKPVDSFLHFDFRDGDSDPNPEDIYDAHGSSVSGVLAARGNNGIGVTGAAPEASLVGVRTIGSFVTDQDIADAVSWNPAGYTAHVSNNSWGYTGAPALRDVDISIKQALQSDAQTGRNGLGQITLFANGNSQEEDDNGNYTTLANSRFVIAVGAIDNFGRQSYYSNPGANLLISAPSNGGSLGIFTTDVSGNLGYNPLYGQPGEPADVNYTANFGGTSSATPLTSGCVSLILGANPNLGWRDVHEILAQTARKVDASDSDWADNGVGFHFNHKYGAGMVDATPAVILGLDWNNLGPETSVSQSLASPAVPVAIPDNNVNGLSRDFDLTAFANVRVERVELKARIRTNHRSELEVALVSPSGKKSILSPIHTQPNFNQTGDDDIDFDTGDATGWPFTSTHYWGENSQGVWKIQVRDGRSGTTATLTGAKLTVYGTASPTQRFRFTQHRSSALESAGQTLLHVERVGGTSGTASVDWVISNAQFAGRAVEGVDYTATPGTLTFNDGDTEKDIVINLIDNAAEDGNRALFVILKNPVNAALGGFALTRLDIVDDESNLVTVVPGDFDIREVGAPSTNPGTFIVSRSKASDQALAINFTVSGTATMGVDYQTISQVVTIPANATSTTVTITPIDDSELEGTETIILTLAAGDGYGVGVPGEAQLNLRDNDQPLVNIVAVDNSATEAGPTTGTFKVSRNDPGTTNELSLPTALLVNLTVSGSAVPGQNYVPIENFVVIPANESHAFITVTPIDDQTYKSPQTVAIRLAPGSEYGFGFSTEDIVTIADNEPIPDPNKPAVTITAPKLGASITSPDSVIATGTAKDNQQVVKILYQLDDGSFQPIPDSGITGDDLSKSWQIDLTTSIIPGPHVLKIKAVDNYDNESLVISRAFGYLTTRTLSVVSDGSGTVSRGYAPSSGRNAGFTYSINATPAAGSIFAGWTGITNSTQRTYSFIMPNQDTTLTAHFIPNPFGPNVAGSYQGTIESPNGFSLSGSGFLAIKVNPTGTFTGSVLFGGVKTPIKGEFTGDQPNVGTAQFIGSAKRKAPLLPLLLNLQIDTTANTNQLVGTIGTFDGNSEVVADRAAYNKKTNPYSGALGGKPQLFTLHIPPPLPAGATIPKGNGFGTASIDANGIVKWKGQLPDGTKVSQTTQLSRAQVFPLFVNLFGGQGVVLGRVVVDPSAVDNDMFGTLDWTKISRQKDKLFPTGYTIVGTPVRGSIYVPPVAPSPVLPNLTSATLHFGEGNLGAKEFNTMIQVQAGNRVSVVPPNAEGTSLKIAAAAGTFTGFFKHPVSGVKTPFGGILFQKTDNGFGGFAGSLPLRAAGSIQTGTVSFTPTP